MNGSHIIRLRQFFTAAHLFSLLTNTMERVIPPATIGAGGTSSSPEHTVSERNLQRSNTIFYNIIETSSRNFFFYFFSDSAASSSSNCFNFHLATSSPASAAFPYQCLALVIFFLM